ncbi:MAG: alanine racemase, partial [Thermoanaerobaculia bacterium]|nr:alanine racemase [Thermoanaerobaculia bacterium]
RMQLGRESGPITVSTLAEADFFADAGFGDITYAVPIAPSKLDRAAVLMRRIEQLHLLVDHPDAVKAIEEFGRSHDLTFSVFLKVDCGYHRAGVEPESEEALALARLVRDADHLDLTGVLTHAGHSYHASDPEGIRAVAAQESQAVSNFANRLETEGITGIRRSIGSTPTAAVVHRFDGADEVRPGNYVFFDFFQAAIGACSIEDCAASVLSSVVSVYPARRQILIDAGALALSKDLGPVHLDGRASSYGAILLDGRVRDDMRLVSLSQEHGQIETATEETAALVRIGQKVRILVNHSCLTAAMHDRYQVTRGEELAGEWHPVRGW